MEGPSIKDYFKGKTIFVTGGTGFIGKVLLEKLLRSCPDLEKIYVLIRSKKGKSIEQRLDEITSLPLFDLLRSKYPENIKKLVPINGDATDSRLGIAIALPIILSEVNYLFLDDTSGVSDENRQKLVNDVQIFYHAAASVKFDDFLHNAVFTNIRSAREAAMLALEMKKIEVFLHVSTTYCNIDNRKVVEPILYPPHGDWREAIRVAEECDPDILNIFTQKYIGVFPNTYTYTKQLAEHCINDLLTGKIPTVLFRPSIVLSTAYEPFQGWIDNFNGPVGLLIAGGSGLMRTTYADRDLVFDYVAVDNIVKMMVVMAWHKALVKNTDKLEIYHGSKYDSMPFKANITIEFAKRLYWAVPFEKKIWFPGMSLTKCWYNYYINVLLFHMLPAFFLDILLRLAGYQPIIFKIQRKIYIANMAVNYFSLNEWLFVNTNTMELQKFIPDQEQDEFRYDRNPDDDEKFYQYYLSSCNLARQILLKENKEIKQTTKDRTLWMYYLDRFCHWVFYIGVFWMVFIKMNIIVVLWEGLVDYWVGL